MIEKTFNIYCDESTHLEHDGHPYMLYGYVSIASNQIKICKEQIKAIKEKYNYTDELKWINIHDKTFQVYKELVEYFFMTDMQFRVMIADKMRTDTSRHDLQSITNAGLDICLDIPSPETPSAYR